MRGPVAEGSVFVAVLFIALVGAGALAGTPTPDDGPAPAPSELPPPGANSLVRSVPSLEDVPRHAAVLAPRNDLGPWAFRGEAPEPLDLPFVVNGPVWNDPLPQARPSMAVDGRGRLYVAFEHRASAADVDVYAAWSDNGGETWSAPVPVTATTAKETNPSLIANGDIVTVFIQQDAVPDAFVYIQSSDRGATWTPIVIGSGAPLTNFSFPSFTSNGVQAYGQYQAWCTFSPDCLPGAWTTLLLWNFDIGNAFGWFGTFLSVTPDFELFHPSTAFKANTGEIVAAMEYEVVNNTNWDALWFLFDPADAINPISGLAAFCGNFCPSNYSVWPSIATDNDRIVVGANFFNGTSLVPFNVTLALFSLDGGLNYDLVNGTALLDNTAAEQKYVDFELRGSRLSATYRLGTELRFVNSTDTGATVSPPARVSGNTPGTAIDDARVASLVALADEALVAWVDNRDGDADIFFAGQRYRATVDTSPSGLLVRFDGGPWLAAPAVGRLLAGTTHTIEAQAFQPGSPGTRYALTNWSDGQTANPRTHVANGPASFRADFRLQYEIAVATDPPGRSVLADGTPQAGPYSLWCEVGTTHSLDVTTPQAIAPGTRYRFTGWNDSGPQARQVSCTQPISLRASFVLEYLLALLDDDPAGTGASVVTQTSTDGWYAANATVVLVAAESTTNAAGDERYVFERWAEANQANRVLQFTMTGPRTVTLEWRHQVLVQIVTNPLIPEVRATIDGTPVPEDGLFIDAGVEVDLAVPAEVVSSGRTFRFVRFTGLEGGPATPFTTTTPVTVVAEYRELGLLDSPAFLGGLIALVVAVLLLVFFLWWRRRKGPPAPAPPGAAGAPPTVPPPPPDIETMECPSCGMTVEAKAGPCPFCGAAITPPMPAEDERTRKLEEAYRSGRIGEAVYKANLEKLRKKE